MEQAFFTEFWLPFLLIFARMAAFIAVLPFFAWQGIPVMLRVFFSFILALLLTLTLEVELPLPVTNLELILNLLREAAVGIVLGFVVYIFLSTFLMAGQFMDHKAGLMMSGVFEPLFGGQVTVMGQFFYFLAVVFYLSVDGHHMLFLSLRDSFEMIPLAGGFMTPSLMWDFVHTFGSVFVIAFQIAAPVVIIVWILDIALGFISRTVPQIHVFIVGLPLRIFFALFVFMLMLPLLSGVMMDVFDLLREDFLLIMENW